MGDYEHRSWPAWRRHMAYVFLALNFLFQLRLKFKKTPALTLPQAQRLVMVVLLLVSLNKKQALEIIRYHTRRNYAACKSHRKKCLLEMKILYTKMSL